MKRSILLFLFLAVYAQLTFSQSVGTTEGVFNVSDMGAANYSIPIKVPDGINGMQPSLALVYSSQGGNGPLGMGWAISGLSAITRTGNTIYHDSKVNGISLTSSDRFALDGNRLMVTSGTYGASTSKYRTEVETFKDITANGTLGTGPQSFTVTDQNGWTYEYGNTTDSRQVPVGKTEAVTWYLNKVKDLNGNYITYEYTNIEGDVLPKYVKYNCNQNTGLTFQTYVYFSYASKTDPNISYVAGGNIKTAKKLNSIKVIQKVNSLWYSYRSYIPEYSDDSYTHLTKITEKGTNETEALNPTEFTYGTTTSISNEIDASSIDDGSNAFIPLDYNGDGLSDVVRIPTNVGAFSNPGSRQWSLFKNMGNHTFTFIQSGSLPNLNNNGDNIVDPNEFYDIVHGWKGISMFDYNGDGFDDMVIKNEFNNNSNEVFYVRLSNGTTGFDLPSYNLKKANGTDFGNNQTYTGDFDGDGKTEIIAIGRFSGDYGYIIGEKYLTSKSFGKTPYEFVSPFYYDASAKTYVIDYNGDGKSDIMWVKNGYSYIYEMNVTFDGNNNPVLGAPLFNLVYTGGYPTFSHNVNIGDFNGDGISDVLTNFENSSQTTVWEIGYGNGTGYFVLSPNQPFTGKKQVIVSDFNGDSKSDIFVNTSSARQMYYSKGNDAFKFESLSVGEIENSVFLFAPSFRYCSSDFNGDGSTDILGDSKSSGTLKILNFHPNENKHLLSNITNGLDATTTINYLPLSSSLVYAPGNNTYTYPYVKRTISLKVVSNIISDNAVNSTGNTTTYTYRGLRLHAQGKGLMGFENVRIFDVASRMASEKSFLLNTTYAFPYLEAAYGKYVKPNNTEETLNTTTNSYSVYHYGSKRIFPYQVMSYQYNALTGEAVQVTNNYVFPSGPYTLAGVTYSHNIGKPFSITTNKGNGLEITTQTFSYPNSSTFHTSGTTYAPIWVYSRPSKVVTTNTRQGQPGYSRTATFTYDNTTGLINKTVSDPGTSGEVYNQFYYNSYGYPKDKYTFGTNVPLKQEKMEYDASNRYVTKSYFVSHPAIQNNVTYDGLTGNKLTETAPDGFATTYTYDAFGRLKTTSNNNGLSTTTTYNWGYSLPGDNVSYYGAVYYVSNTSNTGAVTNALYDRLGREMKSKNKNFQGQWVSTQKAYNIKGQLASTTKPYFDNASPQHINYSYDAYGRQIQVAAPEGNTTYTYGPVGSDYYTVGTTNPAGQTTSVKNDASGAKASVTDASGNILSYTYHSNGNVKSVTGAGTTLQTYTYDTYNNLTERSDPNYGIYKYTYDAYGQMLSQADPKNQTYTFKYDALGRMYQKTGPEGNYDYTFENNTGTNCGKMTSLSGPEGKITYSYGLGDKVNSINYNDNGLAAGITGNANYGNYNYNYTYDNMGRLATRQYPSGSLVYNSYGSNGDLIATVDNATGTVFYLKQNENALGQTTAYRQQSILGNNILTTENTFDSYNLLTGQKTTSSNIGVVRDIAYAFNPASGNLNYRKDNKHGLEEAFGYDNLNRLIGITNPNNPALNIDMQFSITGNIEEKTDAGGSFEYDQANRVSTINLNSAQPQNIPHATQELSYTPFDKVSTIEEGNYHTKFHYWPDGSRSMMVTTDNAAGTSRYKMYAPDVEMEYDPTANKNTAYNYVQGPEGKIIGIDAVENASHKDYFVLTDHLGSFTQIIDEQGNIVEEKSFDAWGRLRNPQTWEPYPSNIDAGQPQQLFERGYTGHEHLPYYGIINMNGRLYDPVMGRMFSPDVNIIGTNDLQGYNRYTYAMNNPLKFNDPTGNTPDYYAPLWQKYNTAYSAFMYYGGQTYIDQAAAVWALNFNQSIDGGMVAGYTLSGGINSSVMTAEVAFEPSNIIKFDNSINTSYLKETGAFFERTWDGIKNGVRSALEAGDRLNNSFGNAWGGAAENSIVNDAYQYVDSKMGKHTDPYLGYDGFKNNGLPTMTKTWSVLATTVSFGTYGAFIGTAAWGTSATTWNTISLVGGYYNTVDALTNSRLPGSNVMNTGYNGMLNVGAAIDFGDAIQGNPLGVFNFGLRTYLWLSPTN